MDLKTLETRAKQGLDKAEQGWREFAEAMREIKEGAAYEEAGYRYFQTYYNEVWKEQTGKAFSTFGTYLTALESVEEMEKVHDGVVDLTPPSGVKAASDLGAIKDPKERETFWREKILPDHPDGRIAHEPLRAKIREHKGEPPREKPEESTEPRVRDVLSEDDLNALPSKHLDASEKLAYRSSSIKSLVKGVDPAKTVDTMRKNPDTFESKIDDWREIVEVGQEIIAEAEKAQRQPLRVVGGE